ncbi:MAG TPA: hypothetical protein QGF70_03360, partial [Candidatus Thalassarchaeaceae archaeon]|nr:hypothetical protein [Candidatus Thalassarchaeaceae archaeon]
FDTPGTKYIRLTVTDEEYSSTSDVIIEVSEVSGGFFGAMGKTAGISNLLIVLIVVIGALAAVGVTVGLKKSGDEQLLHSDEEEVSDASSDNEEEE